MSSFTCGKTVTFNRTVKVYYYRQRLVEPDVNWQQVANDRHRFKRRMLDIEQKIGWVFAKRHPSRIFNMYHSRKCFCSQYRCVYARIANIV